MGQRFLYLETLYWITMKELMQILVQWYKDNHYSQGDDYIVTYTSSGLWIISHSNDYPMQHGAGKSVRLTNEQVDEIINKHGKN